MAEIPPADPIREQIAANRATALEAIDGTGAYHNALAIDPVRGPAPASPEDLTELPVVYLQDGDEGNPDEGTGGLLRWTLPLTVEGWLRAGDATTGLPTLANRLLADIERAMMTSPTCEGLAKKLVITGRSTTVDVPPGSLATVRVTFEVQYTTKIGDPASKG